MGPLAVLAVLGATIALSVSASNPVVDFEARCVTLGPAEVPGVLLREASIYMPYVAIFADGSRLSLDIDGALSSLHDALLAMQSFGEIATNACKTKMEVYVRANFLIPCVEANGVAMPRKLCEDICNDLWIPCAPVLDLVAFNAHLPTCGQRGNWYRVVDSFPDSVEGLHVGILMPEEYHVSLHHCFYKYSCSY